MGATAIGADNSGRTESGRASGAGTIEAGHAVAGKNRLYKTVNDTFSAQKYVK